MPEDPGEGLGSELSEQEWRRRLTREQFRVLREKATDRPFSGEFTHPGRRGLFRCAGCGTELFSSADQFDSGSGWPSFSAPVSPAAVVELSDRSHGMVRTEVLCARCGGHLGHLFDDGPRPSGLRYCVNSTSLRLDEDPPS